MLKFCLILVKTNQRTPHLKKIHKNHLRTFLAEIHVTTRVCFKSHQIVLYEQLFHRMISRSFRSNLKGMGEEFIFSDDYEADKYLLFEFQTEEELQEVMNGTKKIEFVSNKTDPIVLCTENKTYDILEFDTSNLLLVHDESLVLSGNSSTFELRDKPPPFLSLRALLHSHPITEAEIQGEEIGNPILIDDLRDNTLCSIQEFENMLQDLCVITVDGAVKTPTKEMENLIIDQILQYARTIKEWKRIDATECLSSIHIPLIDYQPMKNIFMAVLNYYSFATDDSINILDEKKVTRHIAEFVFNTSKHSRNGFISKSQFEEEMSEYLPTLEKFNYNDLLGLYVTKPRGLQYINEESLPIDVLDRFESLFRINSEWEAHEIEPFFAHFVTEKLPFQDLAARHCRFADGRWMRR